ncbi:unnamed protein product [Durusdinium trenchii]|uniref:Uncharacterized protein n=1 Tax=Durusdinium trenchii TaxID=1381693 RepID=A0ABP0PJ05_9DINO
MRYGPGCLLLADMGLTLAALVNAEAACDVSLLQTGLNLEEAQSTGRVKTCCKRTGQQSGFEQEVQALSEHLDQLDHQLGDLPNASRYYQKMQEFQDLSQMEFQSELTQLTVVSRGFNSWCNAHSDLVLGFLSFLACSVLIALCIPCGLAPVQLIAWAISEEKPEPSHARKETPG